MRVSCGLGEVDGNDFTVGTDSIAFDVNSVYPLDELVPVVVLYEVLQLCHDRVVFGIVVVQARVRSGRNTGCVGTAFWCVAVDVRVRVEDRVEPLRVAVVVNTRIEKDSVKRLLVPTLQPSQAQMRVTVDSCVSSRRREFSTPS